MDYGGGIINTGNIFCYNCTFHDNYAKYGGAIFNQGNLEIYNCTFTSNTAYKDVGNNILNAKQGNVTINGKPTLHNEDNTNSSLVEYREGWGLRSDLLAYASYFVGLGVGFLIGAFVPGLGYYAGLLISSLAGSFFGACIGGIGVSVFFSKSFDVTLNRQKIALTTIGTCAISGFVGGMIGGSIGQIYKLEHKKNNQIKKENNKELIKEDKKENNKELIKEDKKENNKELIKDDKKELINDKNPNVQKTEVVEEKPLKIEWRNNDGLSPIVKEKILRTVGCFLDIDEQGEIKGWTGFDKGKINKVYYDSVYEKNKFNPLTNKVWIQYTTQENTNKMIELTFNKGYNLENFKDNILDNQKVI